MRVYSSKNSAREPRRRVRTSVLVGLAASMVAALLVCVDADAEIAESAVPIGEMALLPFSLSSIWRLGISDTASFASDNDPRNLEIRRAGLAGDVASWVNSEEYSHPINYASAADPFVLITDTVHGGSWWDRVPARMRISGGVDKHMHVVSPDGRTVHEYFGVERKSISEITVARRAVVALDGEGLGPQGGVRAYGGSAIGGLIRGWEVNASDPSYSGEIRHALALSLRPDQLYVDGSGQQPGSLGYFASLERPPRPIFGWPLDRWTYEGFMKQSGYVWPATEQDYNSITEYSGSVPMGTYFAIPASTALSSLQLKTREGAMLALAAQNYGVYVTDASGSDSFYAEDDGGAALAFAEALRAGEGASDLKKVFSSLRAVERNTSVTPNGGPLYSTRRP